MGSLSPPPPAAVVAPLQKPIFHIVSFRFATSTPSTIRSEISARFLALQQACLSPTTGKSYIRSFTGGRDVSVETLQRGFSHVFVLEFATEQDRDWYVHHDPVHREFGVRVLTGFVEEVMVLDFRRGEF